ncbi:hypothetical protein I79_004270 [Cricetulus griseus]|uniref:Uncharacterized protein n=1 Tax=Cricetulus griseus TaxID=10029 RepID=G3H299_CRIGR|nr:hypothetical protein I79_004270 [Cricetulus griseus]
MHSSGRPAVYHKCARTIYTPAARVFVPCAYLDCIVFLIWLDDLEIQKELSKHQEGIQDHQADDDNLVGRSKKT